VGIELLSVGIDIALVSIGHGRVDDRGVGLSTRMISAGDEVTSLGTYPVSLVLWCHQATSWGSDSGTNSSMKPKVASSETAEPVELDTRSVFPTTTRHYSYISSSLFSLHAQNSDHQRSRACSVTGRLTSKLRI
jgi:hypothetical protein